MRIACAAWQWLRLVSMLLGLSTFHLPAQAQVGAYWERPPAFDGTQARGSWETSKAFSAQKVIELRRPTPPRKGDWLIKSLSYEQAIPNETRGRVG